MSKAHDPHWRYLAFRIERADGAAAISRRAVTRELRKACASWAETDLPQLTRYEWPHGIVRVHHYVLDDVGSKLTAITSIFDSGATVQVRIETLSSSGTIKALTRRLGLLQERAKPDTPKRGKRGGPGARGVPPPGRPR